MRRFTLALLFAGLLGGCAALSGPAPVTPSPELLLPLHWSGELPPARDPQGSWWRSFDDPLLAALVDEALARNLDLQSARLALLRARALREVMAAADGPQLGGGASAGRNRAGGRGATSLRAGLDASWEVDLFGTHAAASAAATADAEAAAATLHATRLAVAAETTLAVLQWQGLRAQAGVAAASLASQQQTLELVQWRQRAGLSSALELEQARSGADSARARLAALRHSQSQAEHVLAVMVGQPPTALAERLAAAPAGHAAAPALPALPQPAALLQRRWDLQAAQQRIGAQLATLAQREAERRPRFTLGGNLALQAATWLALGTSGALLAGLTAAVDWTLFDGGAGMARVAAQQAALDSARVAWQAAVLAALQDVEDGLSALARQRERVQALASASASADEALRLARAGYGAGLNDFLALLDSERSALGAADALAAARTELATSHVRLYQAIGGGFAADGSDAATASAPP